MCWINIPSFQMLSLALVFLVRIRLGIIYYAFHFESTRINVSNPLLSFVASEVASKNPGKEITDTSYVVIENV